MHGVERALLLADVRMLSSVSEPRHRTSLFKLQPIWPRLATASDPCPLLPCGEMQVAELTKVDLSRNSIKSLPDKLGSIGTLTLLDVR
jgi:Leucine-rich repeat (LRR) protein